jgi:hypothetical protein
MNSIAGAMTLNFFEASRRDFRSAFLDEPENDEKYFYGKRLHHR